LYMDRNVEHPPDVILSVDCLRLELSRLAGKVRYDSKLKTLIKDMVTECRLFMNYSSSTKGYEWHELETMRFRLGFLILRLKEDYGCIIRGHLHQILPRS
jgi:hypothetical protein